MWSWRALVRERRKSLASTTQVFRPTTHVLCIAVSPGTDRRGPLLIDRDMTRSWRLAAVIFGRNAVWRGPIWSPTSLGDIGVGLLAAIGVVQALFHRDSTGTGQFVDSSIIYAHLLNASMASVSTDRGTVGARPSLDLDQTGRLSSRRSSRRCRPAVGRRLWTFGGFPASWPHRTQS